jgi:hypothetical protein
MSDSKTEHNPKRYSQLDRPYAGVADAVSAVNDFFHLIERMRFHVGVPDVVVIARTTHLNEAGEVEESMSELFLGDSEMSARMLLASVQKNFRRASEKPPRKATT